MEMSESSADDEDIVRFKERASRKRGRGFNLDSVESQYSRELSKNSNRSYSLSRDDDNGPKRSVEGWILFATNVHEEAEEAEVMELFKEYGTIMNVHVNLDRRTGYSKGYALIEYETYKEAKEARTNLNGATLLGHELKVDWCFIKNPIRIPARRSKKN